MNNPIASAIKQICDDRGIPQEQVIEALEAALAAAYRKDFGEKNQNIKVDFDLKTGDSRVFDVKTVVDDLPPEEETDEKDEKEEEKKEDAKASGKQEELAEVEEGEDERRRFNPKTDIQVSEIRETRPDAEVGDEIRTELSAPAEYGRMAAQTAKQVIIQKIREAERTILFDTFKGKEDAIVIGVVQRREDSRVLIDLGKVTAILPHNEQIARERYMSGDRVKVYVKSVGESNRGPEIIVSRATPLMVKKIFDSEIPEIASGAIEIKGVSRDAGNRSKVAVWTTQDTIDPIGSCIGQRGSRIQMIIAELGGEKIDVIQYDDDPKAFIANALSPAKISSIELFPETKIARVLVGEDQLSLAIGKMGQNVKLASQLTGWNIEVHQEGVVREYRKGVKDADDQDAGEEIDMRKSATDEDRTDDAPPLIEN
ncbi:transcription termination/antitermination protein NusA [Candidatus Uhrbacteria bacterium]|nr:transcription termination/antitermination protein NusA [Candidatus Uhrbacteria bacterium]